MRRYTLWNNIVGWVAFLISAIVYIMTIEPTASFWDCGEFIATSANLLVGHPPGAPFFMIVGRFFSLFTSDRAMIPVMINAMSALASAFTILFLFWTITHFAKKLIYDGKGEMKGWQLGAILSSGFVGALAYTFSDTFWFSAVEGEVYAMSSLFTAVVFWLVLKWENAADKPHANRYLILIAYLMGLSIGVHLLNLLTIPAIGMVYYYKKYEVNRNNTIKALLISSAILLGILYVVIPGVVYLASRFELMFVNGFGLGFNSGAIFYACLLIGGIIWGLWYTYKKSKVLLNTAITVVAVIIIGYSSFAMIVIRSAAEPTMDQNSPDDVFSLMGYLNREQYGDRPLISGQYYNSPIDRRASNEKEGAPIRIKKGDRYEVIDNRTEYVFDSRTTTIFPRMYSREGRHINQYKSWANIKGKRITVEDDSGKPKTIMLPTFGENLKFFFKYQVMHMYFRYFMWNFSGRQNDMQGNGEINKGNWITGIPFIDKGMVGDDSLLPDIYSKNKARNKYYMLPLILGLVGIFFQFSKGRKGKQGFWVVMLLFFLTGLAIVLYLNQTPLQPRERDYAYAGSFYAFAIWIGLGVLAIVEALKKYLPGSVSVGIAGVLSFALVPALMASENWDDHDRSERYVARDLAYNYLNTCQENAILFTNGDNDTFPLWYIQEVERVRTDVRVCNLSYLQTDWYIDQMKRKAYKSDPLPFSLTHDKYVTGKREVVHLVERVNEAIDLKQGIDFLASDDSRTKTLPNYPGNIDYLPAKKFSLNVDSQKVINGGIVSKDAAHLISNKLNISLDKDYILKNEVMILDLLVSNNWNRPIYFATTVGSENYVGLENYFQLEGFGYQLVPIKSEGDAYNNGRVDTEKMYNNVVNKFRWGGFDNPNVYLDENHVRMGNNIRMNLTRLANALIEEEKNDKAKDILDLTFKTLPSERIPHTYFSIFMADAYYRISEAEKGDTILEDVATNNLKELKYYMSLPANKKSAHDRDIKNCLAIYREIGNMANNYGRNDIMKNFDADYQGAFQRFMR
ncbi:MAG: DUF2723 domain-containing protein [Marinilabiliaceae bacterium]|nr:DUF2723 domain-containing protein [Marinilabiliaceae bacterium]